MSLYNIHDDENALQGTPGRISPGVWRYIETDMKTDRSKLISGTYIHPDLVPSIAGWISAEFQLKANRVVNRYVVDEWKAKLEATERAATQLLFNLHQSQFALQNSEDHNKQLQTEIHEKNEQINEKNELIQVKDTLINIKQDAVEMLNEAVCDEIKEKQVWSTTHAFTMLKIHDESNKHSHYVIRCQRKTMNGSITKIRRKFQAAEVIYMQKKVPNSINLYTRLKQQKMLAHSHNLCTPTCNEQELLYHLNSLCGTYFPASNPHPHNVYMKQE